MLGEILEIGEKALIDVPKESREWGYNPAPNGTEVTVLGFDEIHYGWGNTLGRKAGVYQNYCWIKIAFPGGDSATISSCHLSPYSSEVYEERLKKARENGRLLTPTYLRPLPETRFWLDDQVSYQWFPKHSFPDGLATITGIKYHYIGQKRDDGSPMPMYDISDKWPSGWYTWADDFDRWSLVERGKVWKYYNNVPIQWTSDEEHARFLSNVGETDYVRNPKDNLYRWTKEEAVNALKDGLGHAISVGGGLFGSGPYTDVILFKDKELGEKIRLLTIKGFNT